MFFLEFSNNFKIFPGHLLKGAPLPGISESGKIFCLPEKPAYILYQVLNKFLVCHLRIQEGKTLIAFRIIFRQPELSTIVLLH